MLDLTLTDLSISSKSRITRAIVWSYDVCTIGIVPVTIVCIVSTFINVWIGIDRPCLWSWSRTLKLKGKRVERSPIYENHALTDIRLPFIYIDSVLASFANFSRWHDKVSSTEVCLVPVQLCPSQLNPGLQLHLNYSLVLVQVVDILLQGWLFWEHVSTPEVN